MAQTPYTVRGQVIDPQGRAVAGVTVVAVDKDLRSDQELGRGESDASGRFLIEYDPSAFASGDASGPDMIVRVVDG